MNDATRPEETPLRTLVNKSNLVVCVGSGGVGKTTTAAAIAIAAAREGKRAAVLTIDPARRLAQALGVEKMGNTPKALSSDVTAPGNVDAMMLETAECFDDLIGRLVEDDDRRERLLNNRLYQVVARHLGGTHEYMAVEKLFALTASGDYDIVVLDTPPSVNALDFLDAPKRLSSFFSEKITKFFIKRDADKKGLIARLRDRAGELAVSILGKALGETFMDDVRDFATAFQGLFGAFRERGEAIERMLADPGTSFVVVTGADPVRVAEAVEFASTLTRIGVKPRGYIVNRVHPMPEEIAPIAPEDVADVVGTGQDQRATEVAAALTQIHQTRVALAERDADGLARMRSNAKKQAVLVVPELEDEVKDRSAVEHVLRALGAREAASA